MSPLAHAAAHNTPSFPRVSGDEPVTPVIDAFVD